MKRTKRIYTPEFKAEVAIAAVQAGAITQQVSDRFGVHRNLVRLWRDALVERAEEVFSARSGGVRAPRRVRACRETRVIRLAAANHNDITTTSGENHVWDVQ